MSKQGWFSALSAANKGLAAAIHSATAVTVNTLNIAEGLAIQGRLAELESRKEALTDAAVKSKQQLDEMRNLLNSPELSFKQLQEELLDL